MQAKHKLKNNPPRRPPDYRPNWYLAQIKTGGFTQAVTNLRQQGFGVFMPLRALSVRHARQIKQVKRPIFPGYLFVQFDPEQAHWRAINSTRGVVRLVCFQANKPTIVPQPLIDGLMARCDSEHILLPLDDLQIGERVRLMSGAFAEFTGKIETFIGDDVVRILLDLMGQTVRADTIRHDLDRLGEITAK